MMHPLRRLMPLAVLMLAALLALSGQLQAQTTDEPCMVDFEATVRRGPSEGLSLTGTLILAVDEGGSASGMLTAGDSAEVVVVGQVNGRAINLLFDLGDEQYIFGVGTLQNDFARCEGVIGGPFAGPQPGDSGDWGYALGGHQRS